MRNFNPYRVTQDPTEPFIVMGVSQYSPALECAVQSNSAIVVVLPADVVYSLTGKIFLTFNVKRRWGFVEPPYEIHYLLEYSRNDLDEVIYLGKPVELWSQVPPEKSFLTKGKILQFDHQLEELEICTSPDFDVYTSLILGKEHVHAQRDHYLEIMYSGKNNEPGVRIHSFSR